MRADEKEKQTMHGQGLSGWRKQHILLQPDNDMLQPVQKKRDSKAIG